MEDEGEEEEEDEYDRDEREDEGRDYYRDEDREDEQEERDASREEVVQIPEQSSDEPTEGDTDDGDDGEGNLREQFDEEEEVDNLQDDRMMDQDEGGMLLFGQTEKDWPDQTGFESFKRVS